MTRVRTRPRQLVPAYGDLLLGLGLAAAAITEAVIEGGHEPPLLAALTGLALIWRQRWPMVVMLAIFLAAEISREAPYVEILCVTIGAYSIGAHERQRLLGVLELLVICALVIQLLGGQLPVVPSMFGPFVVTIPLWLAGNAIRQGRERAEALVERAARIEREKELSLQAAHGDERARIARELHDVVAHSVSVMVIQAGAARHVVEQSPEKAIQALETVEETGREAMRELRQILGVLGRSDGGTAPQPSLDGIEKLVSSVRDAGLPVELEVQGEARPIPALLGLTAFRVIQEALTNAMRHSGMAHTSVRLDYRPGELKIEVLSDCAVPPPSGPSEGRGLAGMRERVKSAGGRMEAGPDIERGYRVRVWLPLRSAP